MFQKPASRSTTCTHDVVRNNSDTQFSASQISASSAPPQMPKNPNHLSGGGRIHKLLIKRLLLVYSSPSCLFAICELHWVLRLLDVNIPIAYNLESGFTEIARYHTFSDRCTNWLNCHYPLCLKDDRNPSLFRSNSDLCNDLCLAFSSSTSFLSIQSIEKGGVDTTMHVELDIMFPPGTFNSFTAKLVVFSLNWTLCHNWKPELIRL